jgi:hypothetical protein
MIVIPKSSNPTTNAIMAVIYILYGVIKIGLGLIIIFLEKEDVKDKPIIDILETVMEDNTLAGHMYDYVLMAFGVFTIIHALILIDVLPLWFEEIFVSKLVQYGALVIFGLIMVVFYALVLYTDLPIPKNKDKYVHYLSLGLIGGILFLLTPPFMEFIEYISPYFNNLSVEQQNLCIIAIIISITAISELTYLYLKDSPKEESAKKIMKDRIEIPVPLINE